METGKGGPNTANNEGQQPNATATTTTATRDATHSPVIVRPPTAPLTASGTRTPPPAPILRPAAVTNQNRNVSWQSSNSTDASPKPPMIPSSQHNRNISNISAISTNSAGFGSPYNRGGKAAGAGNGGSRSRTTSLDLYDVLSSGPHELEAETHILRAVEKMTGKAHQRTATETSRLYETIAQDEITSSMIGTCANNNNNKGATGDSSSSRKLVPPGSPTSSSTAGAGPTVTAVNNAATATATTKPATGAGKARFKGLIQKTMQANQRTNTVEQTLFGLSNALSQMDDNSGKKSRNTSVMGTYDTTLKSADKLAATVGEALKKKEEEKRGDVEEGGVKYHQDTIAEGENEDEDDEDQSPSETDQSSGSECANGTASDKGSTSKKGKKKKRHKGGNLLTAASDGLKADFELFNEFLGGKRKSIQSYARKVVLFIMMPSILVAALLFYFVEEFETDEDGNVAPGQDASVSWWILFLGVRQVITLTMAFVTQALVIDYLALGSRLSLKWFGPIITLLVVQSKGWPFVSIFWGVYNLILLTGDERYVRHWFYWQDAIALFNEDNPGGNVINSPINRTVMVLFITVGVIVSVKRLAVGLLLGRQTFSHYGQELATVMKNMVLVGEVATLGKEIEKDRRYYEQSSTANPSVGSALTSDWAPNAISDFVMQEADAVLEAEANDAKNNVASANAADAATAFIMARKSSKDKNPDDAGAKQEGGAAPTPEPLKTEVSNSSDGTPMTPEEFTASEQVKISELLDAWEEPTRAEESEQRKITIGAVMQFRQALTFMKRKYPFLPAFGPADSRDRCIESSQAVYDRLMIRTPHLEALPFETLALLAKDDKGGINQEKAKELIKVFRPERDGSLGKLEFVKGIDVIYKRLRLLSANISNSSQIDKAIESCVNVIFYVILGCVVLSMLGQSPMTIFFSFSSVILGFAFMFGASSAKYFEGVLFILVQRPYGVGDRIHLSNPQNETSPEGSSGWIVEKVSLHTTSVYWGATNERATLSNGAISNLRVINAARSPNATVFVELKFGINTPYEKIAIFRTAVEEFLKERPREWLQFVGFRPTEVAVDRGFIGYKIIAQHRNHWQGIGGILESKANLTTYCLEVAKQLEMRYHAPPLPVDLKMAGGASSALQALQGGAPSRGGGLDQKRINDALRANSTRYMRGRHEAFAAGDGD